MDNEEAKVILSAYRINAEDCAAVEFRTALNQARLDPTLRDWLREEQEFDAVISEKFETVMVPPFLKSSLLAGACVDSGGPETVRPHWLSWVSLAACIVAAAIAAITILPERLTTIDFAEFRQSMTREAAGPIMLDYKSESIASLSDWLQARDMPAGNLLPASIRNQQGIGCKVLEFNGHKVSLYCLRMTDGSEQVVHIFVMDADGNAPLASSRKFDSMGEWSSAIWQAGNKIHLLVGRTSEKNLQTYL